MKTPRCTGPSARRSGRARAMQIDDDSLSRSARASFDARSYSQKSPRFGLTRVAGDVILAAVTLTSRQHGAVSDPARGGPDVSVRSLKTEQYSSA